MSRASEQRPIATLQDVQGHAIIQLRAIQAAGYTMFTSILNNEGGIWRGTTQHLFLDAVRIIYGLTPSGTRKGWLLKLLGKTNLACQN